MNQNPNNIEYVWRCDENVLKGNCLVPFSTEAVSFLSELSQSLMDNPLSKQYPDVLTFAFWCRKANLKVMEACMDESPRIGWGTAFHIAPSNVPVNFAYSLAVSLLSGNSNIVRVPSKRFPQVDIICAEMRNLLENTSHQSISDMTILIRYEHDREITAHFSSICDVRLIWGGDNTIQTIRQCPIPAKSFEITFADRYSFCIINADAFSTAIPEKLAARFYNDTYVIDQNACSSPHLVIWVGEKPAIEYGKKVFWEALQNIARIKYELEPSAAISKYLNFCRNAIEFDGIHNSTRVDNFVFRVQIDKLGANMEDLRGNSGYFLEYETHNLNEAAQIVNRKYQTLTYHGFTKDQLKQFVILNRLSGIDRIVPIGSALEFSSIWDGRDLIRTLSRVIDIRGKE